MTLATRSETELDELDLKVAAHYKPRGDRVLTKPILAPEQTRGGVFLPDTTRERNSLRSVVVSIGPGRLKEDGTRIPIDLKQGQVIAFPIMAGSPVHISGRE